MQKNDAAVSMETVSQLFINAQLTFFGGIAAHKGSVYILEEYYALLRRFCQQVIEPIISHRDITQVQYRYAVI